MVKRSKRPRRPARRGGRARDDRRAHAALAEAQAALQAGNLVDAEARCRGALALDPAAADAAHLLALVLHRTGRPDEGIECLEGAASARPDDAGIANNLGNMLAERGRHAQAVDHYRRAIEIEPARGNTRFNLAVALQRLERWPEAERVLRDVLSAEPDDADALRRLGEVLHRQGRAADAVEPFARAAALSPADLDIQIALAGARRRAGEREAAREALRGLAERGAGSAALYRELAESERELGDEDRAEAACGRALELSPRSPESHLLLGRLHLLALRAPQAVSACREAVALAPDEAEGHWLLGKALVADGGHEAGERALERVLELEPNHADAHHDLAILQLNRGEPERAEQALDRALAIDPMLTRAWFTRSAMRRWGPEDSEDLDRLEAGLRETSLTPEERINLHFALGKMADDRAEASRAFGHFAAGNDLCAKRDHFDPEAFRLRMGAEREIFDAAWFERNAGLGVASELPVFIVGMPRSGTTLVEQILSCHSQVHGAGELTLVPAIAARLAARVGRPYPLCMTPPDRARLEAEARGCLEALSGLRSGGELRVTDKMPGNFMNLGLIATLFPGARVVYCTRDAMDNCLSIYFQLFEGGHAYASSLDHVGTMYREQSRLREHWAEVLPLRLATVRYEALVDDPENESRRLVEFLGLPWEDACLDHTANRRAVHTASNVQVREGVYRRSVARWRAYAPYLGALRVALGELASAP